MDAKELKRCPFCGTALDAQWNRPNPKARCITEGCKGGKLPVLNLDQPDDIEAWNRRAAIAPSDAAQAPTAWVRFRSDGGFEGPIMDSDSRMCDTRRSFWTPLHAHPVAPQAAGDAAQAAQISFDQPALPSPDAQCEAQYGGQVITYHSDEQIIRYAEECVAAAIAAHTSRAAPVPPAAAAPTNAAHVTRRIRRCETETVAQLVLEHFAREHARKALEDAARLVELNGYDGAAVDIRAMDAAHPTVAADAAAPTLLGSPAEGHWCEPETPSDGHKLESDVDEESLPDECAASATAGMNLTQRIAHVGGRENAAGYIEFGSVMAVDALIQHVLRDRATEPQVKKGWSDLYESAMKTLAPAFDYIQSNPKQFGANVGDSKMAIIAETFPMLAAAAAAQQSLLEHIEEILDGIDELETAPGDHGWWETNTGVEFGERCLNKIRALFGETNLRNCATSQTDDSAADACELCSRASSSQATRVQLSTETVDKPVQSPASNELSDGRHD